MRRYSTRNQMHSLAELNVTPLLDLAFVLLIIFMITTPLIENSIDLVVPTSAAAKTKVAPESVQTISIDRNNTLKFNETETTATALEERLVEMKAANPDIAVVIRPHKDLPVQDLIRVMDILDRIGISRVGMMARPEDAVNR